MCFDRRAAGSADTRCTAAVAITDSVTLTFTKTADVDHTTAGSRVRYAVTVTNAGAVAVPDAEFTDALAGVLDDAVYNDDATASAGAVALSGSDLLWEGPVEPGGTVTVAYSVTVRAPPAGDQLLTGGVTSSTLPSSNNCVAGSQDTRCAATVPVAALLVRQAYDRTSATPGTLVRLTATFTNTGRYAYQGISVSSPTRDTLDDAVPLNQSASSGSLVLTPEAITWTGDIPTE